MTSGQGRLVVVGTPIGNLEDISVRATRTLSEADVIFCEDTRRTRKLLSALAIPAPRLVRLDQHNEASIAGQVADQVAAGRTAVLVTDAGMPTISDPGSRVVEAVAGAGGRVDVVPGPTAVSAALALSGMPAGQYRFVGFLARKGRDRREQIDALAAEPVTAVIYEAPTRVARTVADLVAACGPERTVAVAHELTKRHEEVWRGTLAGAAAWLEAGDGEPRGEWVVVLGGSGLGGSAGAGPVEEPSSAEIAAALDARRAAGSDRRQAVSEVAAELKLPKRTVYQVSITPRDGQP